jgi:hypothetical protein
MLTVSLALAALALQPTVAGALRSIDAPLAHLHLDAIELDDGVDGIGRAHLLCLDLLGNGIGHLGDQAGRDFGTVNFLQVDLDVTHTARKVCSKVSLPLKGLKMTRTAHH